MAINIERAAVELAASVTGTQQVTALNNEMAKTKIETLEIAAANEKASRSQKAFITSLLQTEAGLKKGKSGALEYRAELLGIQDTAAPVIARLKQLGIDADHSFMSALKSGGVFREFLVLLHESLIMGNWSRFGGSLMVISERLHLAPILFSAVGAAALSAAAGVGIFAAALIKGEMESTKFAESMSMTGGMAGITEDQFRQMAKVIGDDVPGGATRGRNALLDLIATGQFSGETLLAVGKAATQLSAYTGQSAADVVKDFDDMKGNAADWAKKMNDTYHFLTEAQYEYIEQLQAQGQTEAAEQAAANDLYTSLADNGTHNLGILERAWRAVGGAAHWAFDEMENAGRASTLEDQLATLQATEHSIRGNRAPIDAQIAQVQQQIAAQDAAAAAKAKSDQLQEAGITANDKLPSLTADLLPGPDMVKAKVAELQKTIADALAADPNNKTALYDKSIEPRLIAAIQKKYGNRNMPGEGAALNKPDANGFDIGSDDPAKMTTQLSLMKQYAAATKQSELAVLKLEIAQGKLNGFTAKQIQELKDRAAADDALASTKANTEAQDRYDTQVTDLTQKKIDLTGELTQMQNLGKVTKDAALQMVNLEIAQGKLNGVPAAEINSLKTLAQQVDATDAALAAYKTSGQYGTQSAFDDYVSKATDAGTQMKKVWTDTFDGMEDILVTALEGGKVNFDKFALSVVDDLLKMEVEENILGPLIKMLGSIGGGTNGSGIFSAISSGWGALSSGGAAGVLGEIGGFFKSFFADGGIMTSHGPLPLNMYSNGGIANSPQMAVYGEGRGPEAYVPLPDGRSIPVSMKGGSGGGTMISNTFNISSDGGVSGDNLKNANAMARALTYTIQQELIRQKRDGGILSATAGA